ncbi:thioredoxin domain-containing protein [Arsenicicoccus dermatophilus]|nr:thioredoxin domain-containing protein [Arsenicicoccus dermatophilus]
MSDSKPVVFLVTAPAWCGYCKKLDPVIRKLNAEGQGKWVLAIIDVDKAGGAEKEFGAKGYPTMIAFSKGAEMKNAKRYEGFAGEEGTRTWVDSVVQAAPAPGPTNGPTTAPTNGPTTGPAPAPTDAPTTGPAPAPTDAPTTGPAPAPTDEPTDYPTDYPTDEPTDDPTDEPTDEPTWDPGDEDWGDWDDDGEWLTRSQFMPLNQAPQAKAKALAQAKAPVKR